MTLCASMTRLTAANTTEQPQLSVVHFRFDENQRPLLGGPP